MSRPPRLCTLASQARSEARYPVRGGAGAHLWLQLGVALLFASAAMACGDRSRPSPSLEGADVTADVASEDTAPGGEDPDVPEDNDVSEGNDTPDIQDEEEGDGVVDPTPYPAPDAWRSNRGPGGPTRTFTADELFEPCAELPKDERDRVEHHNLHVMYDGYLLKPWAPEWGGGGLVFYRFDDPCSPSIVGSGYSRRMRESHSIGFSSIGGEWAVVAMLRGFLDGGIQFWDISDPSAPEAVFDLTLEGHVYPDAYARVVLSAFWQAPYVYVAHTDLGVVIVDATNPLAPEVLGTWQTDPILRAGQVHAVGDLLIVTAADGPRTVLLDISDPARPQPIPGGDFVITDDEGVPRDAYFSNFSGGMTIYARKDRGSGILLYDISDPTQPRRLGGIRNEGAGGYVFIKDRWAFSGESDFGAVYDISDPSDILEVGRFYLAGDLDTVTPIGNVALVSVDDGAEPGRGTVVTPWRQEPDVEAPYVNFVWPRDGAADLRTTSRIGLSFNEMVDVRSAFAGSVRLWETELGPLNGQVRGHISVQENIVNFWPVEGLQRGTSYTLEVPAGGIVDYNGNAITEPFSATFRTR